VLSNWLAFAATSVVSFFLSPFVIGHLGDSAYGVWVLMGSLTGYMGLLDLGVRGAVTRYVASFHTQRNHQEASRVVSAALLIFIGLGLVAVGIAVALAFLALKSFNIPLEFQKSAQIVLILSGLTVATSLIGGVFGGVIAGLQRFDRTNAIEISTTLLRSAAVVIALAGGRGLVSLSLIHLFFSSLALTLNLIVSRRTYPELRPQFGELDRRYFQIIFSFSAYAFLLHISNYLIFYTDSVVIGAVLPISSVTFFGIAGNLINYSRALVSGISTTMTPMMSSLQAAGAKVELERVLLKGMRYATLIVLPIGITFIVRGHTFISLWMTPRLADHSSPLLTILTVALFFAAATQVATAAVLGMNRHKSLVPIVLAEAIANLGLSIILVRRMGIVGVAWGTALPSLAVSLLFWPIYMRSALSINTFRLLSSTWIRPAIALLPFAACTVAIDRFFPPANLAMFFFQVAAALPFALFGAWYVSLLPDERQQCLHLVSKLLPSVGGE